MPYYALIQTLNNLNPDNSKFVISDLFHPKFPFSYHFSTSKQVLPLGL